MNASDFTPLPEVRPVTTPVRKINLDDFPPDRSQRGFAPFGGGYSSGGRDNDAALARAQAAYDAQH